MTRTHSKRDPNLENYPYNYTHILSRIRTYAYWVIWTLRILCDFLFSAGDAFLALQVVEVRFSMQHSGPWECRGLGNMG